MNINSVVNNSTISNALHDTYNFIKNNSSELNKIFSDIYTDISNQYTDVTMTGDSINISFKTEKLASSSYDKIVDCVQHHLENTKCNNRQVGDYVFNVIKNKENIKIIKKR